MENFVVSARKYRPVTFDTVIGQPSITITLKNALRDNHLAQAFLFCGPRGVGKTTCARILAKTINCEKISENIEACNQCDSCKSFSTGHSLNIFELDAASNNSVDDIRNLISQVSFSPQLGKYKVYIIDEVHMLSQAAFNAFLKTLEEPPKHAVFILATTEKHKIIPTILSRCQIFDFSRIQVNDIVNHIQKIAENENVEAEPDALHTIAQKSDGALRDALSMFDQLVNFAGKKLTYQSVIANLNVLDYDYYFKITDEIIQYKITSSLLIFNEILNEGFDGHNFILGLAEHFRNLLVCKDQATVQLLETSNNIKTKYLEQSAKCTEQNLFAFLEIANKCDVQYKTSKNQRLLVELTLMQLCSVNFSPEKKNSDVKILPPENSTNGETKYQPFKQYAKLVQKPMTVNETEISNSEKTKHRLRTNSLSIAGILNPAKKSEEQVLTLEKPCENFSVEKMLQIWNTCIDIVKKNGKESLFSILSKRSPQLRENFCIELILENKVQHDIVNATKPDILDFFRAGLNNYFIELNLIVNFESGEKIAYTNREKFMKLTEKKPLLSKFRQQLDLEVD